MGRNEAKIRTATPAEQKGSRGQQGRNFQTKPDTAVRLLIFLLIAPRKTYPPINEYVHGTHAHKYPQQRYNEYVRKKNQNKTKPVFAKSYHIPILKACNSPPAVQTIWQRVKECDQGGGW